MSTPIPPNSRVAGLELYAPRRARAQSVAADQKQSFADDQEQPAAGDQEQWLADGQDGPPAGLTGAPENDRPQVPEGDSWEADAESADAVQARIDNVAEAVFDVECEFREVHVAPLQRAPRLMSSQDETLAPLPRAARLMPSRDGYPICKETVVGSIGAYRCARGSIRTLCPNRRSTRSTVFVPC
jgi:hypothetical protein